MAKIELHTAQLNIAKPNVGETIRCERCGAKMKRCGIENTNLPTWFIRNKVCDTCFSEFLDWWFIPDKES